MGPILPLIGHLAQSGNILTCHPREGKEEIYLFVQAKDAYKDPAVRRLSHNGLPGPVLPKLRLMHLSFSFEIYAF